MDRLLATIPMRFPSLNEYIDANRSDPRAGSRMKRRLTEACAWCFKGKAIDGFPARLRIVYREPNRRRDIDNITYAAKYILDGMVEAGAIPDDSQRYICSIESVVDVDRDNPRVEVWLLP